MNLKCLLGLQTQGRGPCGVGGGNHGHRKEAKDCWLGGGAVRGHREERRDNVGLNRPPCHGLFLTHACL